MFAVEIRTGGGIAKRTATWERVSEHSTRDMAKFHARIKYGRGNSRVRIVEVKAK